MPIFSIKTKNIVQQSLNNLNVSYNLLYDLDKEYMQNITSNDRYRIGKALEIYIQTSLTPTEYFKQHQPKPIIKNLKIFEIATDIDILRKRIQQRTKQMIQNGIIDEVIYLEKNYTREPNCMSSIGIKETLDYLDGKIDKDKLEELISIHTAQLAKRQRTFNKSQFCNIFSESLEKLEKKIFSMV